MKEICLVVSKNDTKKFESEAHFITGLPVFIPAGLYKAQVFQMGNSMRILLVDESPGKDPQQFLI